MFENNIVMPEKIVHRRKKINMDNFWTVASPLERMFPHDLQVRYIGHLPDKRDWIHHAFDTVNYSFILEGEGEYHSPEGGVEVQAPCVLTQWPGAKMRYGPKKNWRELFLIYAEKSTGTLAKRRFLRSGLRWWNIRDTAPILSCFRQVTECMQGNTGEDWDMVDRLCETMILHSLRGVGGDAEDPKEIVCREVADRVEREPLGEYDFDQLAFDRGMTPHDFRKVWNATFGVPPHKYQIRCKVQKACSRLLETNKAVGEIAKELGYSDPLYFSRQFAKELGMSARKYRETHRNFPDAKSNHN